LVSLVSEIDGTTPLCVSGSALYFCARTPPPDDWP